MAEFPYLYPHSRAEASRRGEKDRYEESFRQNVSCARAIEQAIRDYFNEADDGLKEGCAQSVLEQYGFRRVNFVLANSLRETGFQYLISDETHQWGQGTFVPADGKYNRYFAVDTAAACLESFIRQARDAYQSLGLFGPEHCVEESKRLDYNGKVLVLRPDVMKESCWSPQNCLWEAHAGFGCSPTAVGRAVYATCLGDGEQARWDRGDFIGVLKDEFLPDWAREKLEELHAPKQEGPSMGGMS